LNPLLISLIEDTLSLYQSGEYEVIKIQEDQFFLFDPPESLTLTDEDSRLEKLGVYLLYQWYLAHNKTRYRKIIKEVYVPNNVAHDFKDIDFDDIMNLISVQTKDTL